VTPSVQHLYFPPLHSLPAQALQQVVEGSTNSFSFQHGDRSIVVSALIVPLVAFIVTVAQVSYRCLQWQIWHQQHGLCVLGTSHRRTWRRSVANWHQDNRLNMVRHHKTSLCHDSKIVLTVVAVPRRQGRTPDDVTDFIAG